MIKSDSENQGKAFQKCKEDTCLVYQSKECPECKKGTECTNKIGRFKHLPEYPQCWSCEGKENTICYWCTWL